MACTNVSSATEAATEARLRDMLTAVASRPVLCAAHGSGQRAVGCVLVDAGQPSRRGATADDVAAFDLCVQFLLFPKTGVAFGHLACCMCSGILMHLNFLVVLLKGLAASGVFWALAGIL